jgi:uncharacterized protein (DUF1330 family)
MFTTPDRQLTLPRVCAEGDKSAHDQGDIKSLASQHGGAGQDQQGRKTMAAYFVAVRTALKNPREMEMYGSKGRASMAGHHVKALAAYGKIRSTDGPPTDGAVILGFPTFEAAEAWYDSPAYQEAVVHRFAGADYRTFIIQGV